MNLFTCPLLVLLVLVSSCESEQGRKAREAAEEKVRIAKAERQEERDKYLNSSLATGSTPYDYCFGGNGNCSAYGCSNIVVKSPSNADVIVTIKKQGAVYAHAYIGAGNQYTFDLPNGTYQTFFYYGKGWNPNKWMKAASCGDLTGGFIESEHFGKDSPQALVDNILSYELILQQNGNFQTKPSNANEAF
jgi:hypothetical protein